MGLKYPICKSKRQLAQKHVCVRPVYANALTTEEHKTDGSYRRTFASKGCTSLLFGEMALRQTVSTDILVPEFTWKRSRDGSHPRLLVIGVSKPGGIRIYGGHYSVLEWCALR